MRVPILLTIALTLLGQSPEGLFLGEIAGGMGKLRLALEIKQSADGKFSSHLISIDQGYAKLPAAATTFVDKTLKLNLGNINAGYEGTLSDDGQTLTGTFTQGIAMPLVLKRIAELPRPPRPQEPKEPYPYLSEDLTFAGGAAGVTLSGTLTRPKEGTRFAAVVLVSGSGPQDRNEELAFHKPFLLWADTITRAGIAVLRYDDRGTAKSTGSFRGATSKDFAMDAASAVAYLRTRKDIDAAKIFVMVHSEGGVIAPMVAAEDPKIAGIVLLAGTAITGERILARQLPDLGRAAGLNEEQAAANAKLGLEKIMKEKATDPWMAFFWDYDPVPAIKKVKCPVLALNGELDMLVNAKENLGAMELAFRESGNKRTTIKALPNLNHLFQTAKTGSGQEYSNVEETVSPIALEEVTKWLKSILATK